MNNDIEILNEEHLYDTDLKLKHLGYGEWVEEVDILQFNYKGYFCEVYRIFAKEPYAKEEAYFGGHLCGYVKIPENHSCYNKHYFNIDIDCHGGLTFSKNTEDGYMIGFDCGHLNDYVPSLKNCKKSKDQLLEEIFPTPEEFKNSAIFYETYRNVNFVIEECKSIVDQLIITKEKTKEKI